MTSEEKKLLQAKHRLEEAQAVEPALGLAVFLQPDESNALVGEAPRLDEPQGLRELRERSPQKKHAVRGRQIRHRERA